jgi:hypothetical protein
VAKLWIDYKAGDTRGSCQRSPGHVTPWLASLTHSRFRWVECQLNTLKDCINLADIRQELKQLPRSLDETYSRVLNNIPEKYRKKAHCLMQILAVSRRPLTLEEVAEAVAVDYENEEFDPVCHRLLDPSYVLKICSSLVTTRSDAYSFSCTI